MIASSVLDITNTDFKMRLVKEFRELQIGHLSCPQTFLALHLHCVQGWEQVQEKAVCWVLLVLYIKHVQDEQHVSQLLVSMSGSTEMLLDQAPACNHPSEPAQKITRCFGNV